MSEKYLNRHRLWKIFRRAILDFWTLEFRIFKGFWILNRFESLKSKTPSFSFWCGLVVLVTNHDRNSTCCYFATVTIRDQYGECLPPYCKKAFSAIPTGLKCETRRNYFYRDCHIYHSTWRDRKPIHLCNNLFRVTNRDRHVEKFSRPSHTMTDMSLAFSGFFYHGIYIEKNY